MALLAACAAPCRELNVHIAVSSTARKPARFSCIASRNTELGSTGPCGKTQAPLKMPFGDSPIEDGAETGLHVEGRSLLGLDYIHSSLPVDSMQLQGSLNIHSSLPVDSMQLQGSLKKNPFLPSLLDVLLEGEESENEVVQVSSLKKEGDIVDAVVKQMTHQMTPHPTRGRCNHGKTQPRQGRSCLPGLRRRLSTDAIDLIDEVFAKCVTTGDCPDMTRESALKLFSGAFGHLSVDAMFSEVDTNDDKCISYPEFLAFWQQVRKSGYSNEDLMDELDAMLSGKGTWVDFDDDRCPVARGQTKSLSKKNRS